MPVPFDGNVLIGHQFLSSEELPVNELRGAPRVRWHVRFDDDACTWGYHDVTIRGGYEVLDDGTILARIVTSW